MRSIEQVSKFGIRTAVLWCALAGCGMGPVADPESDEPTPEEEVTDSRPAVDTRKSATQTDGGQTDSALPLSVDAASDAGQSADAAAVVADALGLDGGTGRDGAGDMGPPVPVGTVLFKDRFAAGDLTGWMPSSGTWALCPHGDKMAYCQTGTDMARSFVGDPTWTDYEIRAVVVLPDDVLPGFVQIFFRSASSSRGWTYAVGRLTEKYGKSWEIGPISSTSQGHTNGGAFYYEKGVPFTIHVRIKGDTMTSVSPYRHSNGQVTPFTFTGTKSSYPSAGRVGVGSKGQGVKILSFQVTKL